jgi:GT2 family glycosyltransferase
MLGTLAAQTVQPAEMVVVDASADSATEELLRQRIDGLLTRVIYARAGARGAAAQRNQAFAHVVQPFVLFMDDDILLESECIARMWQVIRAQDDLGGVNAMITNQKYHPPGRISRALFRVLNGASEESYAGKCIGPALNLLPEDRDDLPEVADVEWLNTTCTLYRRAALPDAPFESHFAGYSMMEDLALSLHVARNWRLANARTARIFHDSEHSGAKRNVFAMSRMELVNRHYVMCRILGRSSAADYLRLLALEVFGVLSSLRSPPELTKLPAVLGGKLAAIAAIVRNPSG